MPKYIPTYPKNHKKATFLIKRNGKQKNGKFHQSVTNAKKIKNCYYTAETDP